MLRELLSFSTATAAASRCHAEIFNAPGGEETTTECTESRIDASGDDVGVQMNLTYVCKATRNTTKSCFCIQSGKKK